MNISKKKIAGALALTVLVPMGAHYAIQIAACADRVAVAVVDRFVDGAIQTAAASVNYVPAEGDDTNLTAFDIMNEEAPKFGLSPSFGRALLSVESAGRQTALSPKGAIGLMQIMPDNAKFCGHSSPDGLVRRRANIRCGLKIISTNIKNRNGNVVEALHEYNGGPRCVKNRCGESVEHARRVLALWLRDIS